MTETTYVPTEWAEEYVPDQHEDINKFIIKQKDGTFCISYEDPHEAERYCIDVKDGERVAFSKHRMLGVYYVETDEYAKPIMPPDYPAWGSQHMFNSAVESQYDTLEELFDDLEENGSRPPEPNTRHEVQVRHWSEHDFIFREFPKPHLEEATPLPAPC